MSTLMETKLRFQKPQKLKYHYLLKRKDDGRVLTEYNEGKTISFGSKREVDVSVSEGNIFSRALLFIY